MTSEKLPLAPGLIAELKQTEQNPKYHAEGSVYAHTLMVLEKFETFQDQFGLSESDREVLYWTTVLHDLGKIPTTRMEGGRWRAPGHEKASLPFARNILLQQPQVTPEQRRRILSIIRWHGIPLGWVNGKRPLSDLKLLSTQVDLKLLATFGWFDFMGRISSDHGTTLKKIEHFMNVEVPRVEFEFGKHETLQETFSNWNLKLKNAAWSALGMRRADLLEKLFQSEQPDEERKIGKVIVTIGPPLAGKTHFLDQEYKDTFRVNLEEFKLTEEYLEDDFKLDRRLVEFRHMLGIYLRHHGKVILEGRNVDTKLRTKLNENLRKLPIEIEYLVFETSMDEIRKRNESQDTALPIGKLNEAYRKFSIVHPWEAHQTTFV